MPIPKSFSKKKKKFYQEKPCRHLKKPDTDNLQKLYLDCMSGILFSDDSIVNIRSAIKIYAAGECKTVIKVYPKRDTVSPEDIIHYDL